MPSLDCRAGDTAAARELSARGKQHGQQMGSTRARANLAAFSGTNLRTVNYFTVGFITLHISPQLRLSLVAMLCFFWT